MSLLLDQKLEQENMKKIMVKLLTNQKLKPENLNDVAMDQSVNQLRTAEDDPECVAYQEQYRSEVETTWWFDTGAYAPCDAEVRWRENLTLRGANGQDLGAMGDLLVRGFMAKTQVQFRVVVARDARQCFLSGPQLRAKGHPFILNQHESFFHSARRRHTSDDVTCRRQISQSCVHAEAMRCTVGNLFAVESFTGKCLTRIAQRQNSTA